ncbi:MarC family protein [Sphingomonas sp. TREG-RG-20F-R18-01]|uniref:MarC family protein n=1 Tax=Sphingomonas sp. TREG-RG-20F-R18-01 TaxID=2914982 RepID=UPI001F5A1BCC|nr:MarC family protein [Sphingomonas sp. TREG-RG-20F-R18-01]
MSALDTNALVTMTVGLFAITAPIAVLPLFVAATASQTAGDQRRTALVAAATYVVAGLLALFIGNAALGVFGVSVAALRVAGMAVIGVIGWQMLNAPTPTEATPTQSHHHRASNTHVPVPAHNAVAPSPTSVGILPLGFPIYAGPGVLSVIIAWGSGSRPVYLAAIVAILANAAIIVALDFLAAPITRVIGEEALLITEKIFGLLVVAIAVGGMASALVVLFPGLGGR